MAWEKLGSASVDPATIANTSWKELDRVTLTSSDDTLDTGTFTAKDNIMILENKIPTGSCRSKYQFNADTGDNYAQRYNDNGGTDGTFTSDPVIYAYHSGGSAKSFSVHSIINNSSQEKLLIGNIVENGGDGAGNAPNRQELVGKWANTSAQINRVKLFNDGSGSFDTGSEIVVLGCDNDEADSGTNFWQELASVTASGSSTTLNSGTFTAKKYLMVEVYGTTGGSNMDNIGYRVNSDSGSNYARRVSHNGGTDSTSASQDYIRFGGGSAAANDILVNTFIVNKSDTEKLFINECNRNRSTGAGNASDRFENTSKWANTSSQITSIQLINDANNWTTDSFIKVYGAD